MNLHIKDKIQKHGELKIRNFVIRNEAIHVRLLIKHSYSRSTIESRVSSFNRGALMLDDEAQRR